MLLTSSYDYYLKIWKLDGTLLCSLNINHPLPTLWNVKVNTVLKKKKNILFSLKVIELIFKRYKRNMHLAE